MKQPQSDWVFLLLRGLALLVLGWALGALYGLTSLGILGLFLPVSTMLLGFSVAHAQAAGWLVTMCACVGALSVFSQQFPVFHPVLPAVWGGYLIAGLVGQRIGSLLPRAGLRIYMLFLLMAVGAGMAWQAYPMLFAGIFRSTDEAVGRVSVNIWLTFYASCIAGLLGGMTKLGGGSLLVPLLVFLHVAPHTAIWLSIWLMLPLALVAGYGGLRRSSLSWSREGWLALGAFVGGVGGGTWALGFSAGMLVLCFSVALVAVSLVMWRVVSLVERVTSS